MGAREIGANAAQRFQRVGYAFLLHQAAGHAQQQRIGRQLQFRSQPLPGAADVLIAEPFVIHAVAHDADFVGGRPLNLHGELLHRGGDGDAGVHHAPHPAVDSTPARAIAEGIVEVSAADDGGSAGQLGGGEAE